MGYTEEETNLYNHMMSDLEEFDKVRKELLKHKCVVHNKKLKIIVGYGERYTIEINLSNYCCLDFAIQIEKKFIETKIPATIEIN